MTYGPPQRFKIVDANTGESEVVNLIKLFPAKDANGEIVIWCNIGMSPIPISKYKDDPPKIYQSTGHHDANGTEVFFGDVCLLRPGWSHRESLLAVVKMEKSQIIFERIHSDSNQYNYFELELQTGSVHVIGNIHMSPESLQAAAEKVRAERD